MYALIKRFSREMAEELDGSQPGSYLAVSDVVLHELRSDFSEFSRIR